MLEIKNLTITYNMGPSNVYAVDNVSKKVLRVILSYTDYVNRTVWKKLDR